MGDVSTVCQRHLLFSKIGHRDRYGAPPVKDIVLGIRLWKILHFSYAGHPSRMFLNFPTGTSGQML